MPAVRLATLAIVFFVMLSACKDDDIGSDPSKSVTILDEGSGATNTLPLFPLAYGTITGNAQIGPRFQVQDGRILRRSRVVSDRVVETENWVQEDELGIYLAGTGEGLIDVPLLLVPHEVRMGMAWEQVLSDTLTFRAQVVDHDPALGAWKIERGFVGGDPDTFTYYEGKGLNPVLWFAADGLEDPAPIVLDEEMLPTRRVDDAPHVTRVRLDGSAMPIGGWVEISKFAPDPIVFDLGSVVPQYYEIAFADFPAPGPIVQQVPSVFVDEGNVDEGTNTLVPPFTPRWRQFIRNERGWALPLTAIGTVHGTLEVDGEMTMIEAWPTGRVERIQDGVRTDLGQFQLQEGEHLGSAWLLPDGTLQGVAVAQVPYSESIDGTSAWIEAEAAGREQVVPVPDYMAAGPHHGDVEVCWTGEPDRDSDSWTLDGVPVAQVLPTRPSCLLLLRDWSVVEADQVQQIASGSSVVTGSVEGFGSVTLHTAQPSGPVGLYGERERRFIRGHVLESMISPDRFCDEVDRVDPGLCYRTRTADSGAEVTVDDGVETTVLGPMREGGRLIVPLAGGVVVPAASGTNEQVWYRVGQPEVRFDVSGSPAIATLNDDGICARLDGRLTCYAFPGLEVVGSLDLTDLSVTERPSFLLVEDLSTGEATWIDSGTWSATTIGTLPDNVLGADALGDGRASAVVRGTFPLEVLLISPDGFEHFVLPDLPVPNSANQTNRRVFTDADGVYVEYGYDWTWRFAWEDLPAAP